MCSGVLRHEDVMNMVKGLGHLSEELGDVCTNTDESPPPTHPPTKGLVTKSTPLLSVTKVLLPSMGEIRSMSSFLFC